MAVLIIQLSRFFLIGRSDRCDYQIASLAVSKLHCRLYAVSTRRYPFVANLD